MALLQDFKILDTRHLDEARQIVGKKFCSHRLEVMKSTSRFHVKHCVAPGRLLSLNHLSYSAKVLIEPGELEHFYLIQIPLSGHAEISNGGWEFETGTNNAAILNPDRHTKMVWHAGCEQLMVYLPKKPLWGLAQEVLGRNLTHELVFHPRIDFTNPRLANWRRNVLALARAADEGELFGNSRSMNQTLFEEKIVIDLIEHQPSNVQCFASRSPRGIAPKPARNAREFIIENASKPISLKDIAKAGGVPIRTLQHQLKRFYGSAPLEILRGERLNCIHHEIKSGHCVDDIGTVASRWGFTHFGRFSQHYKRSFGELPSKTRLKALQAKTRS